MNTCRFVIQMLNHVSCSDVFSSCFITGIHSHCVSWQWKDEWLNYVLLLRLHRCHHCDVAVVACLLPLPCPSRDCDVVVVTVMLFVISSRGLTFTLWGCCGLSQRYKPTELAHSFFFSFCSWVYFCLCGPFNCVSFHNFFRLLSVFSFCSSGLISALSVLSTIYLFTKVSFSPDI